MRNNLLAIALLLCAGNISYAQNYNPVPIPCKTISITDFIFTNAVTVEAPCIVDEPNTILPINISGNRVVELKASDEIYLDNEVWVQPNSNGNFYAHIEPSEIDLAWYEPIQNPGTVGRYQKLEIGINLPANINQFIDNFIQETGFIRLNPFNPKQVEVRAEFWRNQNSAGTGGWLGPYYVDGFYYEEFYENVDPSQPVTNWSLDPVNSDHNFRIRFAPYVVGLWRCKITVRINKDTPQEQSFSASEFTFNCVSSNKKGYVQVAPNHHTLTIDNQPYFPSGRNIPQPDVSVNSIFNSTYDIHNYDENVNGWDNRKINPLYHRAFRDELSMFKNAGLDDFRFVNFADYYEIEFEKLNNYYDRLNSAWELDRLVEHCENIDLKIYMNLQNHEALQWVGDGTKEWDWPAHDDIIEDPNIPTCYIHDLNDKGYCYHSDPTYGVETPEEFLTNQFSQEFYQYRLRYIISRWGYSTNISVFELRSEMNNTAKYSYPIQVENPNWDPNDPNSPQVFCERTGTEYKYYTNEDNFLTKVSDWNYTMSEYIKTHQHNLHLLSVDYTGCPRKLGNPEIEAINNGDRSYYSPWVDIIAYNHYDATFSRYENIIKNVLDLTYPITDPDINKVPDIINKPVIVSETGLDYGSCDNGVEYMKFVWCTSFTGIAGTGQEWHHQHDLSLIQHNVNFKNFIDGLDFSNNIWQPNYDVRSDLRAAAYYMVSNENKKRAIGVIENRSVNYWSMTTDFSPGSKCNDIANLPSEQDPVIDWQDLVYNVYGAVSHSGGNNKIQVKGLTPHQKYKVDFYSVFSSGWLDSDVKKANSQGELTLKFPTLNDTQTPIVAFKVRENGEPNFMSTYDTIYAHNLPVEETAENEIMLSELSLTDWDNDSLSLDFVISPNPAKELIKISQYFKETVQLYICDSKNNLILVTKMNEESINIDVTGFAPGIYYFSIIDSSNSPHTKKVIKL